MKLRGIIPPVVTPMHADESIDLDGLRRAIDFQLAHRVDGILAVDTPGELRASPTI